VRSNEFDRRASSSTSLREPAPDLLDSHAFDARNLMIAMRTQRQGANGLLLLVGFEIAKLHESHMPKTIRCLAIH
jgi:hypothetical protein